MKSISFKIGLIYILLTIFIISFFTISIYIQQNKLIVKNRELDASIRAEKKYSPLKTLFSDFKKGSIGNLPRTKILNEILNTINTTADDKYIIFNEKGEIFFSSSKDFIIDDFNKKDAINAISNKEFLNHPYSLKIYKTYEAYSYIPVDIPDMEDTVILFKFKMTDLKENLIFLYRIVFTVIIVVLFLQILFGIILYNIVINPIKEINIKSIKIKEGDLSSRVKTKRKDEIGQLGESFNGMAKSIEEKITELEEKNKIMDFELDTASIVQSGIYPKLKNTDFFDISIYHRPLEKVSGDYHDIFKISDNKYGILIADVSGHGVPAALITMRIQDTFRRFVSKYDDTKELFIKINSVLSNLFDNFSCFFSAFYLLVDEEKKIIYSSGGHPIGYLFRPSDKKIFELKTEGFPLGINVEANDKFKSKQWKVKSKDKLILFSDGIIEAVNNKNEQYSTKRLLYMVLKSADSTCHEMSKKIVDNLNSFIGNAKRKDDETLMIIDFK